MSKATEMMAMSIQKRNEIFQSMNKRERAVAVAQDVLDQIEFKKYSAHSGSYVEVNIPNKNIYSQNGDQSLQEMIEAEANACCTVCAMGAAFMSCVRLGNQAVVSDTFSCSGDTFIAKTIRVFTKREMRGMETVFEDEDISDSFTYEERYKLNEYREKLQEDFEALNDRKLDEHEYILRRIMQNVIDNDGRFMVRGVKMSTTAPDKHS